MNLHGGLIAQGQRRAHFVTRDCWRFDPHEGLVPRRPLLEALQRRVNAEGRALKDDMLAAIGRWSGE
jgi:hypothetical protein